MSITSQSISTQVRAITLWQPWASLIALGLKQYETRSWLTSYRGKLLIHAAMRGSKYEEKQAIVDYPLLSTKQRTEMVRLFGSTDFPLGGIVAIADLTQCLQMVNGWVETSPEPGQTVIQAKGDLERAVGDWLPGRYAWRLENVQALSKPIPCKGKQGLWIPNSDLIQAVQGGAA